MDNVPLVFYVIFIIHTMVPTSRKVAFLLGAVTGATDILLMSFLFTNITGQPTSWKTKRVSQRIPCVLLVSSLSIRHLGRSAKYSQPTS